MIYPQKTNYSKPNPSYFVPSVILSNVMSLAPKIDEIRLYAQHQSPDIMCFTETWLRNVVDDSAIHIRDYTIVRRDRTHAQHGGVCMYVKSTIPFSILEEYEKDNHIEVLWCNLRPKRLPRGFSHLIVGTLYHPPAADDVQMTNYLIDTLSNIESSMPNAAIILAGDFNRLNITQLTSQFRLKQLVKFYTRGERTLDLILTNLKSFYQTPNKHSPFGLSDHCTISVIPKQRKKSSNKRKTVIVRDMRPSSKEAFGRFLSTIDWSYLELFKSIDDKYNYFNTMILTGLNIIMPIKSIKLHINDVPWMTGHLKGLINRRQRALKENNQIQFRFYRNRVNRERKLAKSKYYEAKVKEIKDTEPKKWWSECKRLCGMSKPKTDIVSKLLDESPTTYDKINLANDINSAFLEPQENYPKLSSTCKLDTNNYPIPSVSTVLITKQLSSINASKAHGPDNVPNWVLKHFSHMLAPPVCSLINSSFHEEQLPHLWKCANIIPLPKTSKVNDINCDLRPISLTPTISKIAEGYVVQNHVKPAVLKHIRPDQYGCIPKSSTTHALVNLTHQWLKATDGTGSDVRILIMDYKKAFDMIDHNLLISKLKRLEINPHIINWICDFLSNRQQRVKLNNDIFSEWKEILAGVPQGTKLGPWLFLIMINDLEIPAADGEVIFVDDTTTFEIVEKDKASSAQLMADQVSLWSNNNKFQIQPKKCKEMRISFKKHPTIYENLHINGNTIDIVKSVKLLGVTLQDNLKWNQHVDVIIKKASKRLYFLSQLKRAKIHPKDLVKFYITCIRSILTYACQVFHFSLPDYLCTALEQIQKRALRIIYGYDTPYNDALEESGLLKLADYRLMLCDEFFAKVLANPQDQLFKMLPHNNQTVVSLRKMRKFDIATCNTNRFKQSFINSAARRYNDLGSN